MVESEKLKTNIERYERNHDEFIQSFSFNTIMEVFSRHRNLAPVSHIGLPEFEVRLEAPWNDKVVYEWTEFFQLQSSWPPYLYVTGISRMCIVIIYAVLPVFVLSVVKDLTNPKILKELEDNGATVHLSKELLEMSSTILESAANEDNEVEQHPSLPKHLSPSDGCIHMLGIGQEVIIIY